MNQPRRKLLLFTAGVILIIGMLVFCFPNYRQREKAYYASLENYITVTAAVTDIVYSDDGQICLYVSDKSVDFTDTGFTLKGKNAEAAMENGIAEKLYAGSTIEFICAPRYFGDGYKIPIVALCVDGCTILDFQTGFENLNGEYE